MNVKPGDLAIIIGADPKYEDWIGRIVCVLRPDPDAFGFWEIEFQGANPLSADPGSANACFDSDLRPVSGLPDTEQTDQQEPIKETA